MNAIAPQADVELSDDDDRDDEPARVVRGFTYGAFIAAFMWAVMLIGLWAALI